MSGRLSGRVESPNPQSSLAERNRREQLRGLIRILHASLFSKGGGSSSWTSGKIVQLRRQEPAAAIPSPAIRHKEVGVFRSRRKRLGLALAVLSVIALTAVASAIASTSVYTYLGPAGTAWNQTIYQGPDTFGARYYNRVYMALDPLAVGEMCLRYHRSDLSYTAWQCQAFADIYDGTNPFYATNSSGGRLTQDPAKAQCKAAVQMRARQT